MAPTLITTKLAQNIVLHFESSIPDIKAATSQICGIMSSQHPNDSKNVYFVGSTTNNKPSSLVRKDKIHAKKEKKRYGK